MNYRRQAPYHGDDTTRQEWQTRASQELVHMTLAAMTNEQRMDVFSKYCTHCGSTNPRCQCWNDE